LAINTPIQILRTATAGRLPNTTISSNNQYINAGGLALNMTDQILYTSDGTNLITVGSNQNIINVKTSVNVGANVILGLTGLSIGNSTVNVTVNSTIFTGSSLNANNASFLNGIGAASYVQNTDSRTLSGNLTFSGANLTFTTNMSVGANVTLDTAKITFGNSTVNTTVNSTIYQGTSNNSTNFAGSPSSYYANISSPIFTTSAAIGANVTLTVSTITAPTLVGNNLNIVSLANTAIQGRSNSGMGGFFTSNNYYPLVVSNGTANLFYISQESVITTARSSLDGPLQGNKINFDIDNTVYTAARSNYGTLINLINHSLNVDANNLILLGSANYGIYNLMYNGSPSVYENTQIALFAGTTNDLRNQSSYPGTAIGTVNGVRNVLRNYSNSDIGNTIGVYTLINQFDANNTGNINIAYGSFTAIGSITANSSINTGYICFGNYTTGVNVVNRYGIYMQGESNNYLSNTLTIGLNVYLSPNTLSIGNSTVNTTVNSTHFFAGNSTVYGLGNSTSEVLVGATGNLTMNPTSLAIQGGIITGNVTVNSTLLFIGNSTVNTTVNSTIFTGTSNNATNLNGILGSLYQLNSTLAANVATLTSNNSTYLNGILGSLYQTTAGLAANVATLTSNNSVYLNGVLGSLYQLNSTLSANVATLTSNNSVYLNNVLGSLYQLNSTLAANVATLTSNNATNFGGQLPAYFANVTNPIFTTNISVGSNVVVDVAKITLGNSTVNTIVNSSTVSSTNILSNSNIIINPLLISLTAQSSSNTAAYFNSNPASSGSGANILAVGNGTSNTFVISSSGATILSLNSNIDSSVTLLTSNLNVINTVYTAGRVNYNAYLYTINHSLNSNSLNLPVTGSQLIGLGNFTFNGDNTLTENTYVETLYGIYNDNRNNSTNLGVGVVNVYGVKNLVRNYNKAITSNMYGVDTFIGVGNTLYTGNITTAYAYNGSIGTITANSSIGTGYLYSGSYVPSANITGSRFGLYITGESNNYLSNTLVIGANVSISPSVINVGDTTSYVSHNNSTIMLGNSTVNSIVNSTIYTGTSNNSTNFAGNPVGFYANISAPVFTTSVNVGSNVNITTSTITLGNSTVNSTINSTSFTGNTNVITASSMNLNSLAATGLRVASNSSIGAYIIANNSLTIAAFSNGTANALTISGNNGGLVTTTAANGDATVLGFSQLFHINDFAYTAPRTLAAQFVTFRNHGLNTNTTLGDNLNGLYGSSITMYNGFANDNITSENTYSSSMTGYYSSFNNYSTYPGTSTNNMYGFRNLIRNSGTSVVNNAYGVYNQILFGNTATTGNIITAYGVASIIGTVTGNSSIGTGYMYYGSYPVNANVTTKFGLYIQGEGNNYLSNTLTVGANVSLSQSTLFLGNATVNTVINSTAFYSGNLTVYSTGNSTTDILVGLNTNTTINAISISVGNTLSNVVINTSSVTINGTKVGIAGWNNVGSFALASMSTNTAPGATAAGSTLTVYNENSTISQAMTGTWMFLGAGVASSLQGLWLRTV
jgi:hypothetical protein